jgi:methionine-rich copper-binding protein CopC
MTYTVRLIREDGIQLVFGAHSYVIAPNFVTLTRYDANQKEESIQFYVDESVTPNYKRIEVTNAQGFKVDAISAMPKETQQQIEAVVPKGPKAPKAARRALQSVQ